MILPVQLLDSRNWGRGSTKNLFQVVRDYESHVMSHQMCSGLAFGMTNRNGSSPRPDGDLVNKMVQSTSFFFYYLIYFFLTTC